jgi:hypothetical protein
MTMLLTESIPLAETHGAPGPAEPPGQPPPGPDLSVLEDRIPRGLQLPRRLALWTAVLGLMYLVLSYQPLWHTDLWGHLAYGRYTWEHRELPATEPLMPLAEGVPLVQTAWLSQLGGYVLFQQFGVTSLQAMYAATITLAVGMLVFAVLSRTQQSILAGLLTVVTFGGVNYQQLLIIRPQLCGLVCFVALFCLLTARWRPWFWGAVALLMAAWANLHGSFVVGLGLCAALWAGRMSDLLWRTRDWRAWIHDRQVRRLLLVAQVAALATLLNPWGLGLYGAVFATSGHPHLQDLIEWEPLTLRMSQGRAAAVCALALIVAYRCSPRRVSAGEVLLLVGLGGAALWTSRMIHWWAPVAAYYLAVHVAAIVRRSWRTVPRESPRSGKWTVVTVGLAWIFFAYTPFGLTLIHGQPQTPEARADRLRRSVSPRTPLEAVAYLSVHPRTGLIFNTYEWGDYLLWAVPQGLQVFVASHAHLVPAEVWQDYLLMLSAGSGWDDRLDRYGVNTVVLDKSSGRALSAALQRDTANWRIDYEDRLAIILVRRQPL